MKLCLLLLCATALVGVYASPVHKTGRHAKHLKANMVVKAKKHLVKHALHKQTKQDDATCPGQEPMSARGVLTSPGYNEGDYGNNMDCRWTVTVTEGMFARVDFVSMDLQPSCNCWYDWIKIVDGERGDLGSFCGSDTPGPLTGSSNSLEIIFHTDSSRTGDGFKILITDSLEEVFHEPTDHPACPGPDVVSAEDGVIKSLNFGNGGYHNNQVCTWRLTAPDGQYIVLSFMAFDVEETGGCTYDRLTIYDGATDLAHAMTYCGNNLEGDNLPLPFHSTGQEVFVVFTTDGSVTHEGFHITSTLSDAPGFIPADNPSLCSPGPQHIYVDTTTNIYSPFYSSSGYRDLEFSSWLVEAPQGMFLHVHFVDIDVEWDHGCSYDYVTIEDGPSTVNSFVRQRICGWTPPMDFVTTTTTALIQFVSDDFFTGQGFHIELTPVAGEES